jgi:hypothetical protein
MVSNRLSAPPWHLIHSWSGAGRRRKQQGVPIGWRGTMKHEISTALYDYWLSRHRDAAVRASGIRPAELASLLPSLFLIELDPSERPVLRFRYCGVAIARRYGRDLTDEDFLGLWSPSDRVSLHRDLRAVAFRSTGMVTGVLAETMAGGFVSYEMLLLPLAGENTAAGAIGSMVRIGGHDEANRIRARIVSQSLRSIRFLPPAGAAIAQGPLTGVAVLSAASAQARRRYGHLTVLTGGK